MPQRPKFVEHPTEFTSFGVRIENMIKANVKHLTKYNNLKHNL